MLSMWPKVILDVDDEVVSGCEVGDATEDEKYSRHMTALVSKFWCAPRPISLCIATVVGRDPVKEKP